MVEFNKVEPRKWCKQSETPMPVMVWVRGRWPDDDPRLGYQEYMTFLDGPNRYYWTAEVGIDGMPIMQCRRLEQPLEWIL